MRSLFLAALLLLPAAVVAAAPDGRPVRNSFVDRRVANTRQLVAHVEADPVVADRYERHFAMSRRNVLAYLGGLHRGALAQDGVYTIYSVPSDGHVKMHVGRLRHGEPMFLDQAGRPVLVVRCGNPVVLGPVRSAHGNPLAAVPSEPTLGRSLADDADAVAAGDVLMALEPPVPIAPVPTTFVPAPPVDVSVATVGAVPTRGGWNVGGLPLLLPIVGSVASGGHDHHPSTPVPEPATLAPLALGAAALWRRRKRT